MDLWELEHSGKYHIENQSHVYRFRALTVIGHISEDPVDDERIGTKQRRCKYGRATVSMICNLMCRMKLLFPSSGRFAQILTISEKQPGIFSVIDVCASWCNVQHIVGEFWNRFKERLDVREVVLVNDEHTFRVNGAYPESTMNPK